MTELTERDRDILNVLTRRLRVLSLDQIVRTWWADSKTGRQSATRRLQLLASDNLVRIQRAPAHPEIPLPSPVIDWRPGDESPDFGSASYRLQRRWSEHPVITPCVSATQKAANRFGGYCSRPPREVERTHDIHLAAVYLLYRERSPEVLDCWLFEEFIRQERRQKSSERLPDVVIRHGGKDRVIEFGGAYPKEKLSAFHEYCKERMLPYEVW